MNKKKQEKIRNIAIVAHVDHGKTTLVDQLLKQSGTVDSIQDRVMDSDALERERGITILAKNTGILWKDHHINIVDTPGHSDFSGEVERTLQMVEGFLLLVDAAEGVLPGTRFVLQKALHLGLKPIVLINKVDRPDADIQRTESLIHDLFLDLVHDESQLEFSILYGSGKAGFVSRDPNATEGTMEPLFEAILKEIPIPVEKSSSLQFLNTNLDHSDFLGTIAVGRIFSGSLEVGQMVICCKDEMVSRPTKITKIYRFVGLERVVVDRAEFGDIVAVAGFTDPVHIGTTVCEVDKPNPYPYIAVDEPTVSIFFSVNNSPFNGRDGKLLTSRQIKDRLEKEIKTNVALHVEPTENADVFKVSGRGQMHLGVLIENMRREGFELQLSAPEVIYKTIDGVKNEPIELVIVDVPTAYQGAVMENLGKRKSVMKDMHSYENDRVRLEYEVPSRALLGFKSQFMVETRGTGLLTMSFYGYEPYKGDIATRTRGALVSMGNGSVTAYALDNLQQRGILFIKPGDLVYEGMIVGEHSRDNDLDVNPCKAKKLTNMRASGSDDSVKLDPPRDLNLETCLEWIKPDELIEVTPKTIRLRKKVLRSVFRK